MNPNHQVVFSKQSQQSPGVTPGDLIVEVQQLPHDRFRREGDTLHYELEIFEGSASWVP